MNIEDKSKKLLEQLSDESKVELFYKPTILGYLITQELESIHQILSEKKYEPTKKISRYINEVIKEFDRSQPREEDGIAFQLYKIAGAFRETLVNELLISKMQYWQQYLDLRASEEDWKIDLYSRISVLKSLSKILLASDFEIRKLVTKEFKELQTIPHMPEWYLAQCIEKLLGEFGKIFIQITSNHSIHIDSAESLLYNKYKALKLEFVTL